MASSSRERRSTPKTRKEVLLKELGEIAPLLEENNLEFLKHQAEILLHNARIESLKKKIDGNAPPVSPQEGQNPVHV